MFLHVFVSHSAHRWGVLSQQSLQVVSQHTLQQGGCLLQAGACSRGDVCSWGVPARGEGRLETPGADGYCCGRYASYWNAFLFYNAIVFLPTQYWNGDSLPWPLLFDVILQMTLPSFTQFNSVEEKGPIITEIYRNYQRDYYVYSAYNILIQ